MKRIILLLACLIGMATTLPAQRAHSTVKTTKVKKQRDKTPLTWGIRAGMNYATILNAPAGQGVIGFNVGGNLDVGFCNWFHLQTGLYLSMKGVDAEYEVRETPLPATVGASVTYEVHHYYDRFSPIYLEIPVLASFRIGLSDNADIQFGVGPYIAYTPHHEQQYHHEMYGRWTYQSEEISQFDFGLQANIGASIKHFYIGVGYQIGIPSKKIWSIDTYGGGVEHVIRTSNAMLNVGYNF